MAQPRYLMWYDDNPKIPLLAKIDDAIYAYTRRFKRAPTVVLVSENQVPTDETPPDVRIRGVAFVRRNNVWVGREEPLAQPA